MVICKICEKDIQEDKLSQHSIRCKEAAKLKEDLWALRTKMDSYHDKAQRMKNTLETQAIKERKIQQKQLLKKPSFEPSFELGAPLMRAKTQPMKNLIAALQTKNQWSDGSSSSSEDADKSLNSSKMSISTLGNSEPKMTKEEYHKFATQAKKSVCALNNVVIATDKILNWAYNASSAPVDSNMKSELVAQNEEIVDGKVSEFLNDFIGDLSNYMDLQNLYLKKKNETLADDACPKNIEQLGLKFMTQKSSSMRYVKKKETKARPLGFSGFNKFKEDDTSTSNSKNDSVIMEAGSPGLDDSIDSIDDRTPSNKSIQPRKLPNRRQMNLITPSIFKKNSMATNQFEEKVNTPSSGSPTKLVSPTSVLTPAPIHPLLDDLVSPLSGKTDLPPTRTMSKKNSRLIKADSVKILSKNGSNEQMPSILKFTYLEDGPTASPRGSDKNNSMNSIPPSRKTSGANLKAALGKNLNGNLLKSLHFNESTQNKLFPSLQEKGDFSLDSDSSPSNRSPNKHNLGWESPLLRGYYSDTQKRSKTTRMVSLVDSPKVQMDEFEFIKFLGKGAYGTVWLVKKRATNDLYAMKIVDWADRFTQNRIFTLKAERDIYEILQGDYVVKALWTFHCQSFICFVTEFMVGGDFNGILEDVGRLDEDQARFYFAELILAIQSIHELGIVHRDLKPENILMDAKGHCRLTDFGLSEGGFNKLRQQSSPERKSEKAVLDENIQEYLKNKNKQVFNSQNNKDNEVFDVKIGFKEKVQEKEKKSENLFTFLDEEEKPYRAMRSKKPTFFKRGSGMRPTVVQPEKKPTMVGTPDYMAPEIIAPEKFKDQVYNEKSLDWWSLGVILYQFLVGVPPFCDETIDNVFDNILHRRIEWPPIGDEEDGISHNAYDLINKLLEFDPAKRLGANGAHEVMEHPFFTELDWENFAKVNGPIVPCLKNFDGPEPGLEAGPTIFQQEKKNIFNDLLAKSKETQKIDFGGFQLRRLDVLDKLNQDAYKQLKRKKSAEDAPLKST